VSATKRRKSNRSAPPPFSCTLCNAWYHHPKCHYPRCFLNTTSS
jgi:hypothetical protein